MTDFCIERFIITQNIPLSPIHLTIDETDEVDHSDYRFESIRLQSYKNWPCLWMKPERLAAAGFYYTGESDKVKCFECQIEICQWQSDDNPMVDHQRWSDRCRFVRNFPCGNVPIGTDPNLIPAPSPKGKDVCGPYSMVYKPLSGPDNDLDIEETIKYNLQNLGSAKPKHPEYASYDARLHTFDNWPIPLIQNKQELASAGLYYTGSEDQTLCYHCGGGLKNWETRDDAWEQHARWFDNCPYVLMVKGREFISKATGRRYYETDTYEAHATAEADEQMQYEVSSQTNSPPNSVASGDTGIESLGSANLSEDSAEEQPVIKVHPDKPVDKDARMCKICYSRELRMVFIPCGHLLACAECAKNMKICGVCRKPVRITVQAYIP